VIIRGEDAEGHPEDARAKNRVKWREARGAMKMYIDGPTGTGGRGRETPVWG